MRSKFLLGYCIRISMRVNLARLSSLPLPMTSWGSRSKARNWAEEFFSKYVLRTFSSLSTSKLVDFFDPSEQMKGCSHPIGVVTRVEKYS